MVATKSDESSTRSQVELRAKIREISSDSSLSIAEKAKKMQELMYTESIRKSKIDTTDDRENDESTSAKKEDDTSDIQYNDEKKNILGCPHYQVKAILKSPCCGEWFVCRFCHDENSQHNIDRFAVKQMRCMLCKTEQPIDKTCKGCKAEMGKYYCSKCRLIDDGEDKDIFHCDQCGICRRGKKSSYYHCKTCDTCVAQSARDSHLCREKKLHCNCPICDDNLFASTTNIVQTSCGHLMHSDCLSTYIGHSYKCPICCKSLCRTESLFKAIEKYLVLSPMPKEYCGISSQIFCNDCHKRSVAPYHFMYHRCKECRSFNTTVIVTLEADSAANPSVQATDSTSDPLPVSTNTTAIINQVTD